MKETERTQGNIIHEENGRKEERGKQWQKER
jgi:hypothetical protein